MSINTLPLVTPNTLTAYNEKHFGNIALLSNLAYHTTDWSGDAFFTRLFNGEAARGIVSIFWYPVDLYGIYQAAGILGAYEEIEIGTNIWGDSDSHPVKGWKMNRGSVTISAGSYEFERHFNNFLDFGQYTKINVWLPYIGYVELLPDRVYGHKVEFNYVIDFETGSCTCFIEDDNGIIKTAQGQLGIRIPIGSLNYDDRVKGILGGLVGGVGGVVSTAAGVATANPIAITSGLTSIANTAISTMGKLAPSVSNGQGGSMSTFVNAPQSVYIVFERPVINDLGNSSMYGKPLAKTRLLSTLTGYTRIEEIHLNDIHTNDDMEDCANDTELAEIEALLKKGVII